MKSLEVKKLDFSSDTMKLDATGDIVKAIGWKEPGPPTVGASYQQLLNRLLRN